MNKAIGKTHNAETNWHIPRVTRKSASLLALCLFLSLADPPASHASFFGDLPLSLRP